MKVELHPLIAVAFVFCFAVLLGCLANSKGTIKHLEHQIAIRDSVNESNAWIVDSIDKFEPVIVLGKCK